MGTTHNDRRVMAEHRGLRWRHLAILSAVLAAVAAVTALQTRPPVGFVVATLAVGVLAGAVAGPPPFRWRQDAALAVLVFFGGLVRAYYYGMDHGQRWAVLLQALALLMLAYVAALAGLHLLRTRGGRGAAHAPGAGGGRAGR